MQNTVEFLREDVILHQHTNLLTANSIKIFINSRALSNCIVNQDVNLMYPLYKIV